MGTMKAPIWSWFVLGVFLGTVLSAAAQTPVGALAIDERPGDQYGWAVDHETAAAARAAALLECGAGCSVVLTFAQCGAYAADQDADSTAVGWAESFDSAAGARQAALSECGSRGGSGCTVRVWGCNRPVVEEGLGLNQAARRQVQQGLRAEGFDPGGADGLFGPRTRAAIRNWQSARGVRSTGYLDGPQVEALRSRGGSRPPASAGAATSDFGGLEVVFWQSIQNSTNPVEFEAYLEQFPKGVFRALAQARLAALRRSTSDLTMAAGQSAGGSASPASGAGASRARASVSETAGDTDAQRPAGAMFRPDQTCADQTGASCWMEISERPGCYVWNPFPATDETVTWTGACAGSFAQGTGTLTWAVSGGDRQTETGRLVAGQRSGRWVIRQFDGSIWEGPFVDGKTNGTWVIRSANGTVEEWLFRDGERVR